MRAQAGGNLQADNQGTKHSMGSFVECSLDMMNEKKSLKGKAVTLLKSEQIRTHLLARCSVVEVTQMKATASMVLSSGLGFVFK